jgi:hypothetical protein
MAMNLQSNFNITRFITGWLVLWLAHVIGIDFVQEHAPILLLSYLFLVLFSVLVSAVLFYTVLNSTKINKIYFSLANIVIYFFTLWLLYFYIKNDGFFLW